MHHTLETVTRRAFVATLLGVAVYHLALTASTVLTFSLRYPFMDQFRLNLRYLTIPFPQNVLLLENGHRPVLPGLVRLVELNWLGGTQLLQALTSWLAAGVVAGLLLLLIKRDLRGNSVLAASGICAVCTMLVWNAHARMFIHAYEAMHVFYVTFFVVIALYVGVRAPDGAAWKWWIGSIVACIAATFSFGMGIASFAALMTVAIVRERGSLTLLFIALSAFATFLIYYVVLPGADAVQLAVTGFSFPAFVFFTIARVGAVFAELVRLLVPGIAVQGAVSALAGALGLALISVSLLRRRRHHMPFVDMEIFGVGLFAFGLMANILIATSRSMYFFEHTEQLFADRYLFWSSVTWLGLLLYWLRRLIYVTRIKQYSAAAVVLLLSLTAVPPAIWDNEWSANVYRMSTIAAIAMKLGIRNDAQVAEISDSDSATTYRVAEEMRKRNLGMFADLSNLRVGDKLLTGQPSQFAVPVNVGRFDINWPADTSAQMVAGELPQSVASQAQDAELWFAESDGTLIGRAAFTNTGGESRNLLRLGIPTLTGFQGYVLQSRAPAILLARESSGVVKPLSRLERRQTN
jgi:hypothetical protein